MKNGWETKTLNQISTNLDSRRVPITKGVRTSGEYPYYGASGIVDYVADYIFDEDTLLISEDGANLLARSTPIAFPASGKYWVNNHAHILKFDSMTTQRFVELFFESIPLDDYITGAAQPKLNQSALNSIPIPVPPLTEQQRIVSILDEVFEGIATAKANAEKNRQSARALFESHLELVFTQRGQDWIEQTIAHSFKVRSGDFLPAKAMVESGNIDVFGGNGINGRHNQKNLSGDNILIGRVGAKCGNVRRVQGDLWVTDNAFYISEYFHTFDLGFLARALERKDLRRTANQSAQPVISYSTIKEVMLEFPTRKAEQKIIAKKLNSLEEETQRLASLCERKLAALESLKKSLLHQAFSGEL